MNPFRSSEQIEIFNLAVFLFIKYGNDETLLIELAVMTSSDADSSLI